MTEIPAFNRAWLRRFATPFPITSMSPSAYEWVRNSLGLTLLRVNCWMHRWMSEDASIEWKNYSRPSWSYVAWLPEPRRHCVFRSTTLGTISLSGCAIAQSGTSIQVRRNVRRLSTSKSLICDDLNVKLTATPAFAMRQSSRSGFVSEVSRMFGRTSSPSSRSVSSSQLWSAENADILQDVINFKKRMKEDHDAMLRNMRDVEAAWQEVTLRRLSSHLRGGFIVRHTPAGWDVRYADEHDGEERGLG